MRAFVAIAAREIAQRWVLLAVAAVLGWLPVVGMYLDRAGALPFGIAPLVVYVVARAFWIVAFAVGMSLLGRQLHDGKLAFYFARPVSGWAIAGGKLIGAGAAVLLAELLVLAPTALQSETFDGAWILTVAHSGPEDLVAAELFFGCGLVAGVLARSRSSWFAIDAAGLVTVVLLVVRVIDRITTLGQRYWVYYDGRWQRPWELPTAQPLGLEEWRVLIRAENSFLANVHLLWGWLAIAAAVALLAAAAAGVVFGRTDGERAHRALSTTLWSSLCAVGAAGLAVAHWGLR
jgi:hypothetical protein